MTAIDLTMAVDTSALIAIATREEGYVKLARAIFGGGCLFPEPVRVEFMLVMTGRKNVAFDYARALLDDLTSETGVGSALDRVASDAAIAAIPRHAKDIGGVLNLCDLMVYAVAKVTNLPILCTGIDFAKTDAAIHPASRIG